MLQKGFLGEFVVVRPFMAWMCPFVSRKKLLMETTLRILRKISSVESIIPTFILSSFWLPLSLAVAFMGMKMMMMMMILLVLAISNTVSIYTCFFLLVSFVGCVSCMGRRRFHRRRFTSNSRNVNPASNPSIRVLCDGKFFAIIAKRIILRSNA